MQQPLANTMLHGIPLVERTLALNGPIMLATFNVIDDLDFEITLRKQYDSAQKALHAYERLMHCEEWPRPEKAIAAGSFSMRQAAARIELLARLIDGKLPLPDQGNGFIYDGDLAYARTLLMQLQNAAS